VRGYSSSIQAARLDQVWSSSQQEHRKPFVASSSRIASAVGCIVTTPVTGQRITTRQMGRSAP
jgi:hypothetical protein